MVGRWHSRTAGMTNQVWFVPNTRSPLWRLFCHTEKRRFETAALCPALFYVLYSLFNLTTFSSPSLSCHVLLSAALHLFWACWGFLIFLSLPVSSSRFSLVSHLTFLSFFCCSASLHRNTLTPHTCCLICCFCSLFFQLRLQTLFRHTLLLRNRYSVCWMNDVFDSSTDCACVCALVCALASVCETLRATLYSGCVTFMPTYELPLCRSAAFSIYPPLSLSPAVPVTPFSFFLKLLLYCACLL